MRVGLKLALAVLALIKLCVSPVLLCLVLAAWQCTMTGLLAGSLLHNGISVGVTASSPGIDPGNTTDGSRSVAVPTRRALAHSPTDQVIDITLSGLDYLTYSLLHGETWNPEDNTVLFLFKTMLPSCLLFHASGTSGHFLTVELIRGKLRFIANLGSSTTNGFNPGHLIAGEFSDDAWHQLELRRRRNKTIITIDIKTEVAYLPFTNTRINLNDKLYIGGLSNGAWQRNSEHLASRRNFTGCLSDFQWNGHDSLFHELQQEPRSLISSTQKALWECNEYSTYEPINFRTTNDSVRVRNESVADWWRVSFKMRTYQWNSTLTVGSRNGTPVFTLSLQGARIRLEIGDKHIVTIGNNLDDGLWHDIEMTMQNSTQSYIRLDSGSRRRFNVARDTNVSIDTVLFGTSLRSRPGFLGCMRDIIALEKRVTLYQLDGHHVMYGSCFMVDACYPNPCLNGGRCLQVGTTGTCQCDARYTGRHCQSVVRPYLDSCEAYYASGERTSKSYTVKIGHRPPFAVYCNMSGSHGPMTMVRHDHQATTGIDRTQDHHGDYYQHPVRYAVPLADVLAMVQQSGSCRQMIRYTCLGSTLMYSNDIESSQTNDLGARWYSSGNVLQEFWGGASRGSMQCACGVTKSCVVPRLACNCDAMEPSFRIDEGFITQKDLLPVTMVQFSKYKSNVASYFELGPLECYSDAAPTVQTPYPVTVVSSSAVLSSTTANPSSPHDRMTTISLLNVTLAPSLTNRTKRPTHVVLMEDDAQPSGRLGDSQMAILVSVILVLVIVVVLILVVLLRQRAVLCKRRLARSAESGYVQPKTISPWSSSHDDQAASALPLCHLVPSSAVPLRMGVDKEPQETLWDSASSVSTLDASRYLEADGESEITSGVPPRRGILKPKQSRGKTSKPSRGRYSSSSSGSETLHNSLSSIKKQLTIANCGSDSSDLTSRLNDKSLLLLCAHCDQSRKPFQSRRYSMSQSQTCICLLPKESKRDSLAASSSHRLSCSCRSLSDSGESVSDDSCQRSVSSTNSSSRKRSVRFSLSENEAEFTENCHLTETT